MAIFALIWTRYVSRSSASSRFNQNLPIFFFRPSSRDSLGRTFFLFTATSNSMTSCIWELVCRQTTWPYYRKRLCSYMSLILATILTLSQRASHETLWISLCLHIILIMQRSTLRSLNSSAAVSFQVLLQYKRIGLTKHWYTRFFYKQRFFLNSTSVLLNLFMNWASNIA